MHHSLGNTNYHNYSAYKTIRQIIITYTISFLQILPRISTFYFYIPSIFWKINNSNYLTWLAFILQLKLHYSFFCYFRQRNTENIGDEETVVYSHLDSVSLRYNLIFFQFFRKDIGIFRKNHYFTLHQQSRNPSHLTSIEGH